MMRMRMRTVEKKAHGRGEEKRRARKWGTLSFSGEER